MSQGSPASPYNESGTTLAMPPQSVRHKSAAALILVDVINHFDFPDAQRLLKNALPIAARLARLKERARGFGIPVIYVNDNFGPWRSQPMEHIEKLLRPGTPRPGI